jgi:lactoylglutathione lyase
MRLSYAIVFVSDMQRSIAFYRDVIGLPLKFQSPHWTEFASEGATLALHQAELPATGGDPSHKTPAGRCNPGLTVPNLDEFHQRMLAGKVHVIAEPKENFGVRLAHYADPDGLTISVSEERKGR